MPLVVEVLFFVRSASIAVRKSIRIFSKAKWFYHLQMQMIPEGFLMVQVAPKRPKVQNCAKCKIIQDAKICKVQINARQNPSHVLQRLERCEGAKLDLYLGRICMTLCAA